MVNYEEKNEKEDQTMKTRLGVLIFVFLTGMILGVGQPAFLYGCETPTGNAWDPFVGVSVFTLKPISFSGGTKLAGPLSIYLAPDESAPLCTNGNYEGTMFYTVRLSKGSNIYWDEGETGVNEICFGNIGTPGSGGQGDVIMNFLKTVVLTIFPNAKNAQLKSVDNAGASRDSLSFVADIVISVQE
jgi:hypothetical protein